MQLANGVQVLLAPFAGLRGLGQLVLHAAQLVADFRLAGGDPLLDAVDEPGHVGVAVAGGAGLQQRLALQRADQLVVVVGHAALGGLRRHVAVRAAEHRGVLALQHGLHLGVLRLEQLGARALLNPVVEARAVLVFHPVVVGQDGLGGHGLHAVVGHHGLAVGGGEVVFDVALAAGQRGGLDVAHVLAQSLVHVLVGDLQLAAVAAVVAVAGVAVDVVGRLGHDLVKVLAVDADALLGDHLVQIRRLAGEAVGLRVRALGLGHVLEAVLVAAGAAVVLGEAVALVDVDQVGVLLEVVRDVAVFLVRAHRHRDGGQGRADVAGIGGGLRGRFDLGGVLEPGLHEDVVHARLYGPGGVGEARPGDGVRGGGLGFDDGVGPLSADLVGQQVGIAGGGDRAVGDRLALDGHVDLDGAEIIGVLGGIRAGNLIGHVVAAHQAARAPDRQAQDRHGRDRLYNRLFLHIYHPFFYGRPSIS